MQETQEMQVSIPGLGRSAGGENDKHSSILAWEIPWTEEPGGLGSQKSQQILETKHSNSNLQNANFTGGHCYHCHLPLESQTFKLGNIDYLRLNVEILEVLNTRHSSLRMGPKSRSLNFFYMEIEE